MDWLRSSVFGVGGGGIDHQQQPQSGAAADAGEDEPASSGPPSPSPRLRKRSKRDNDGVNNNYDEDDNDDENGSDGDGASGIVGRRINFGSRDNTSDDDDSNKSNSTESSEEEEEDVLNTTVDTVENPIVEDVTNEEEHDCSDGVGISHGDASGGDGDERVYVNDDAVRQHVQMERQHWRDMEWDPDEQKFFYKPGFDEQDGIPTAWQSVEDSLNGDCRDLFLTVGGNKYKLRVALDDDKVHFQFSTISVIKDRNFLCGLSPQQHIKANRRGVTIDSAVSAATGFPLCFRARREGFSSVQNYEAMLKYMFQYKFTVPGAAALALNDIIFCSDRGYWQVGLILLILGFGGSVFGTLMRKEWVPFTYDQRTMVMDICVHHRLAMDTYVHHQMLVKLLEEPFL